MGSDNTAFSLRFPPTKGTSTRARGCGIFTICAGRLSVRGGVRSFYKSDCSSEHHAALQENHMPCQNFPCTLLLNTALKWLLSVLGTSHLRITAWMVDILVTGMSFAACTLCRDSCIYIQWVQFSFFLHFWMILKAKVLPFKWWLNTVIWVTGENKYDCTSHSQTVEAVLLLLAVYL